MCEHLRSYIGGDLRRANELGSGGQVEDRAGTVASSHAIAGPVRTKSGYIKTLDGWRTIAVFSVILYHARPIIIGPFNFQKIQDFGDRGVQLFFAISGILICSRLLEEQRMHGRISLAGFYIRRLFRIQPAAIVFLATIGVLGVIGIIHPTLRASLSALFCFRNFYETSGLILTPEDRYTAHFWSLAVEEHFYFLLPGLIVLARKKIVPLLAVLCVLFAFWPQIAFHIGVYRVEADHWRTDMSLQYLLFPALVAILLTRPAFRSWVTKVSSYNLLIILTFAGIITTQTLLHGHFTGLVILVGFPFVIVSTMLHPEGVLGRLLESLPFVFLGRISYSLYLWQQLFFIREKINSPLVPLQHAPWNLIAALSFAVASYYIVEKPLMRLGHRLAPPATSGRPDLGS
jgi:peptidoglycan/LPS O-acetylase OafA/YrhL